METDDDSDNTELVLSQDTPKKIQTDDDYQDLSDTELVLSQDKPKEIPLETPLPDKNAGELGCGDGSQSDEVENWLKMSKLECLVPRFKGKYI